MTLEIVDRLTVDGKVPSPDDIFEAGGTVEDIEAMLGAAPEWVDAPEAPAKVRIQMGPDLDLSTLEAVAALANDPNIFNRDGTLVHVVRARGEPERIAITAGTARVRELSRPTVAERMAGTADFYSYDMKQGAWVKKYPKEQLVSAVYSRGHWDGIPTLAGLIETPTLRPDGSIVHVTGYDEVTGYVYAPQRTFPAVLENPTQADAMKAYLALFEAFQDFPVSGVGASRALPVALILTLVGRPAIKGAVPAFLFDASTAGSGKSLQSQCASIIAQGREIAVATWSDKPEEVEKVLGGYAMNGAPAILFDNVNGSFGCGPLDKVLTCGDKVSMRVLGSTGQPEVSWRSVIIANGNNVGIQTDTSRRTLIQRLEPMMENPEDRPESTYRIPNLKEWCHANHPRLVVEALNLLRGYIIAGKPNMGLKNWGSFEEFTKLIASAIVWAGGPNILAARVKESGEEDEGTTALRIIMRDWPRLGENGSTAKNAVELLYTREYMRGEGPPDGYAELRTAIETLAKPAKSGYAPDYRTLAMALKGARKRVVGVNYIDNITARDNKPAKWKVMPVSGIQQQGDAAQVELGGVK